MVVVNNPGSWDHVYPPLRHAAWNGCTPTDLVFPFFLAIAGAAGSIALRPAIDARERGEPLPAGVLARCARRAGLLVLLGLLLNGFPAYDLAHLRIPGVLQRIGVAWFAAALVALHAPRRAWVPVALGVAALWGAILLLAPAAVGGVRGLDPDHNVARWLDRAVIGVAHLWRGGPTDPEGILSTLGAVASVLLGFALGEELQRMPRSAQAAGKLALSGALWCAVGALAGVVVPINKTLWTPSYVAWTHGAVLIAAAAAWIVFEVQGARRLAYVLDVFGRNAILLFVGSGAVARILGWIHVAEGASLQAWLHAHLLESWLPPRPASLAWALVSLDAWWLALRPLHQRKIFLRV
jgi:predicted acyltransferase